jgi:hypothetical protein
MEHRIQPRLPIALPARLHFRDGGFLAGRTVNISRGGVFIETLLSGWRDGCADLRIRVPGRGCERQLRIPAFIVHRSGTGIGLMFRSLDAEAEMILDALLQSADSPCRTVS